MAMVNGKAQPPALPPAEYAMVGQGLVEKGKT
jgi:hypothetical protein